MRLATRYGRYGYRRIREMLVVEGWRVNVRRVYRIWRRAYFLLAFGKTAQSADKTTEAGPPVAQ